MAAEEEQPNLIIIVPTLEEVVGLSKIHTAGYSPPLFFTVGDGCLDGCSVGCCSSAAGSSVLKVEKKHHHLSSEQGLS